MTKNGIAIANAVIKNKEKQMNNDYMEPTDCDWCGKTYEYADGTNVLGDNLCPNCRDVYELEEM
jgi:hypothetical protein